MDWNAVERGEDYVRGRILDCCADGKYMSTNNDPTPFVDEHYPKDGFYAN